MSPHHLTHIHSPPLCGASLSHIIRTQGYFEPGIEPLTFCLANDPLYLNV